MKSYAYTVPTLMTEPRRYLAPPRGHSKVIRFLRKLSDQQILELAAVVQLGMQVDGSAAAVRRGLVHFVEEQP